MTVDEALAKAEWIGDQYTDLQIIALHGQFALASTVLAAEVRRLRAAMEYLKRHPYEHLGLRLTEYVESVLDRQPAQPRQED